MWPAVFRSLIRDAQPLGASTCSNCTRLMHASRALAQEATAAASVSAEASQSAAEELGVAASWLYKTIKQKGNVSTAEYFALKQRSFIAKLSFWEKFYYTAGLLGGAVIVYTRVDWDGSKAAAEETKKQKAAELEVKRLELLPSFLSGKSFVADDDQEVEPFEGASPADIVALEAKYRETHRATSTNPMWRLPVFEEEDPFDGMTPEEIDDYMQKKQGR